MRVRTALAAALGVTFLTATAAAQAPGDPIDLEVAPADADEALPELADPDADDTTTPTAAEDDPIPPIELPVEDPDRDLSYWARGEPRFFVAWRFDIGLLFLRPRASIGWGRPHDQWFGVDVNPIVSGEGVGTWSGLRLALDGFDIRVGARTHYGFRRSLLLPAHSYTTETVNLRVGPKARYLSWEAEFTWGTKIGPMIWFGEAAGTYVEAKKDFYVFEETIKVVVDPPWVWRVRTGGAFKVTNLPLTVGPVAELVGVPNRDLIILRLGIVARMKLYDDLEARATIIPQVVSRDKLGIGGGDSFQLGLRWKWATGETPEKD